MCNNVVLFTDLQKRMSADKRHTARFARRSRARAVAVPVSLLPLGGIIILLGITFAILRLLIIG